MLRRFGKKYNTGYSGCTHPPFWTLQPLVVQTHCLSLRSRSTSSRLTALHRFTQKHVTWYVLFYDGPLSPCSLVCIKQKSELELRRCSMSPKDSSQKFKDVTAVNLANLTQIMWATFQSLIVGIAGRILLSTFRVRAKICCFHFSLQVVIPNICPIFM